MAAIMLQTIPSFYTKIFENNSLFLQMHTKNTLFVQTTASSITTARLVFYPLVNIILYYLETLKSSLRSWILFASTINTWTACIQYSSIDSVEKLLQRVDKCLKTCNEQLTLITETREWTDCRALQKETLEEKNQKAFIQLLSKDKNNADQWLSFSGKNRKS